MVGGIILSCYSFGAILWSFISAKLANPENESPLEKIPVGDAYELEYTSDSHVINHVPTMIRICGEIFMFMALLAILLINKRQPKPRFSDLEERLISSRVDSSRNDTLNETG